MASYRNNRAVTLIKIYLSSLAGYYTEYTQTLITLLWNAIIREKLCQLFSCGIVFLLIFAKMSISANLVFSPLQLIRHAANTSNFKLQKISFNFAVKIIWIENSKFQDYFRYLHILGLLASLWLYQRFSVSSFSIPIFWLTSMSGLVFTYWEPLTFYTLACCWNAIAGIGKTGRRQKCRNFPINC